MVAKCVRQLAPGLAPSLGRRTIHATSLLNPLSPGASVNRALLALLLTLLLPLPASANSDYTYFDFEPDIITNYIGSTTELGFVRLTVSIQVASAADLELVQLHEPLLRSAIVELIGEQPEDRIKSLTGREEVRKACFELVNKLLERETKKKVATDLLFTKYLYH